MIFRVPKLQKSISSQLELKGVSCVLNAKNRQVGLEAFIKHCFCFVLSRVQALDTGGFEPVTTFMKPQSHCLTTPCVKASSFQLWVKINACPTNIQKIKSLKQN